MPEVEHPLYGVKPRFDGEPGHMVVTPTTSKYVEANGGDMRVTRVRVFDDEGEFVWSFLMDELKVPFADNLRGIADDLEYLERVVGKRVA